MLNFTDRSCESGGGKVVFRLMVMLLSGGNRSCAFDVGIVQLDDLRESSVLCESL